MQRYDTVRLSATKTAEGFIRDTPIVGRAGILVYQKADGSTYREYRPPEEAFKAESLASLQGKPITLGHKAFVTADNADRVKPIGTILSSGRQDGNNILADVVIYNLDTDARELSCGYTLTLDETAGTTPEGEHYDAIQRDIVYNHVAVCQRGRAGNARLNMDGDEIIDTDERQGGNMADMVKVRLDSGIEYDCAPEVKNELDAVRKDAADKQKELDKVQAKADSLEAELSKEKEARKADAETAKANFDAAVKERIDLLDIAKTHKLENADSLTNEEIKRGVVKAVRGDSINLDGKSADYIEAAFDMAKAEVQAREDGIKNQREQVNKHADSHEDAKDDVAAAYEKLKAAEAELYKGGK